MYEGELSNTLNRWLVEYIRKKSKNVMESLPQLIFSNPYIFATSIFQLFQGVFFFVISRPHTFYVYDTITSLI